MTTNAILATLVPLLFLVGCDGATIKDTSIDTSIGVDDDTGTGTPDIVVTPTSLDFGAVAPEEVGQAAFTVSNIGPDPLDLSAAISSGDPLFSIDASTATLLSGEDVVVTVSFSARDEGVYTGQVTVVSNDPDEPSVVVYLGALVSTTPDPDGDGDGYTSAEDCDDADANVNPGAIEDPSNGIDDDCDGEIDEQLSKDDLDGDGYAEADGDCDDGDAEVNPAAVEVWYDGVDQDCSGGSDYDADYDGYDSSAYGGDDCDDTAATVNPGAVEDPTNGVDDDCDGFVDGGTTDDADNDGYLASVDDCDDTDPAVNPGATEVWYDGVDQACDGGDDYDQDGDGYTSADFGGDDCADTDATIHPGGTEVWYDGVDSDCDGTSDYDQDGDGYDSAAYGGDDCDDLDAAVNPGAIEIWYDGVDQACDGGDDYDQDGDTYQASAYGGADCDDLDATVNPAAAEVWYDGVDQNCDGSSDYDQDGDGVTATLAGGLDCDDTDASISPSVAEVCDGVDNDCDGTVDDGVLVTYYADADTDGYGRSTTSTTACSAPAGYASVSGDCDDSLSAVNPGATETCNSRDDDCDGLVDDGTSSSTSYADSDGDGFGDPSTSNTSCTAPSGYIADGTDCNDTSASINPAATETCDGVDEDCDGVIDDGTGSGTFYADVDGDGYGDPATSTSACSQPSGYVTDGTDCDDTDATAHPGALEVAYDVADNDCDGYQDDMVAATESGWTILGMRSSDGIGSWGVHATEDLNGDGYPELIIAAGSANTSSRTDAGYLAFHDEGDAAIDADLTDGYYYMYGSESSDFFGSSVAVVDDLDGDGDIEIAVGSYQNDSNENSDGQVYIFDIDGESGSDQASSSGADGTIRGESDNGYLGYSLAAGDFDGDGTYDLATGAPGEQSAKGRVYVTFEGDDLGTDDLDATDSNFYITGVSNSDHLGYSVAFGDLTNDGYDDLVACSPDDDDGGSASGTCWLIDGASTRDSSSSVRGSTVSSVDSAVVTGSAASDQVGLTPQSLSIGDIDDDGIIDLAVGVPGYDGASTDGGGVWIYLGGALAGAETVSTAHQVVNGDGALGTAVNMTSDVTRDGVADLLAGATTAGGGYGVVYLFEGGLSSGTWTLPDDQYASWIGEASGDTFGVAISGLQDLDGDGRQDFAVSASGNDDTASAAGKVYVIPAYP